MTNFSTAIILEKRNPLKDKTYPVKLRVIIDRVTRYYSIEWEIADEKEPGKKVKQKYLTQAEFDKVEAPKAREPYKSVKQAFNDTEKKAKELLTVMENPTFDQFKRLFTSKASGGGNVWKYYETYIAECKNENRLGTASSYECSRKSLNDLKGIETANFKQITPEWLRDYAKQMKTKGRSISTIGIYLRPLRSLFNTALRDKVITLDLYPFGNPKDGKYRIPKSKNNKRPLERSEIKALASYSGSPINEMYRDFFLLSYFLVGLNFMDLLTLKWKQLDGNVLQIIRKKTEHTTENDQKAIKLIVNDEALEIIKQYGNPAGVYIFEVVNMKDNPEQIRRKVQNFNRNTNQALKVIAKKLDLSKNISTVFARHSSASHGINTGSTLADIQQALGHKNITTTSNYISGLSKGATSLGNSLKLKETVPLMEPGTETAETQQQQGIETVPETVPVER